MTAASVSPPRIEHSRFRTRSADADWDFFPFGRYGRGYRVNEAQRARVLRIQNWINMGGVPPLALFIVMDAANPWGVVPLALVFLAWVGLPPPAQWLYVRRLPPAERPLTQQDICGFLARTQSRGVALRVLTVETVCAVAFLVMFAAGVRLAMPTVIAGSAYLSATLAYKAWQAYCVRRLQGRLKLSALG